MNNDNGFDLLIDIVFATSPELGGLGPKAEDFVISFFLAEGETLPQFHPRHLLIISEIFLLQDKQYKSKISQAWMRITE